MASREGSDKLSAKNSTEKDSSSGKGTTSKNSEKTDKSKGKDEKASEKKGQKPNSKFTKEEIDQFEKESLTIVFPFVKLKPNTENQDISPNEPRKSTRKEVIDKSEEENGKNDHQEPKEKKPEITPMEPVASVNRRSQR